MYRRLAIGLAALLIAARAAAPPIIAAQLNKRLAEIGEYRGHVEDVDLALLSGGYTLHGLEIEKTSGQVPVPFFRSRRIDMRSSLGGLLRGRAESRFLFDGLQLNFVDAASRAQRQAGEGVDWVSLLQGFTPFEIESVAVRDGEVRFRNFASDPPVDLVLSRIEGSAQGFTRPPGDDEQRTGTVLATARVFDDRPATIRGSFDPRNSHSDFAVHLSTRNVPVTRLNDFTQAYAGFDMKDGRASVDAHLVAREGELDGYIRPSFHDLDIVSFRDEYRNPAKLGWELLLRGSMAIFGDWRENRFTACIPLQGRLGEARVSGWKAVYGVLETAFVEAFQSGFDDPDCEDTSS